VSCGGRWRFGDVFICVVVTSGLYPCGWLDLAQLMSHRCAWLTVMVVEHASLDAVWYRVVSPEKSSLIAVTAARARR
jgi:hypothetical protein